ncbi:MAG: hypothetical protein KDA42_03850 [Planctomycetales bacterium]|nr:hypothetical protein [Planctomycetales bacterium]
MRFLCCTLVSVLFASGCCHHYPPLRLFNPGPAGHQQARTSRFDPYPDPDAGPEIMGGRPRDFDTPVPEPKRVQDNARRLLGLQ